jgi:putative endonuclease
VHCVYILRCRDGSLYTGYARDPEKRAAVHNRGRGAKYTAGRRPVKLVLVERYRSITRALRREHEIKQLSRAAKHALVTRTRVGGLKAAPPAGRAVTR